MIKQFNYRFSHREHSHEIIEESLLDILNKNQLLSMATVTPDNNAWINTAYFVFNEKMQLFIMTYPNSVHGKNLEENNSLAITIFDSNQNSEKGKQGLQLNGICKQAHKEEVKEGIRVYSERFTWLKEHVTTPEDFRTTELLSRMYIIQIEYVKIFDERRFGQERWVEVKIK